jgi:hypothetical protein
MLAGFDTNEFKAFSIVETKENEIKNNKRFHHSFNNDTKNKKFSFSFVGILFSI